jgi:AraC family transcriptional regulator
MTLQTVDSNFGHSATPSLLNSADGEPVARDVYKDTLLEPLVRSLLPPEDADDVLRGFYTSAFHAMLLQRLEQMRIATATCGTSRNAATLQAWRLKRVTVYIDQNIDQPLSLDCLARAAGLSRMHFASLFRKATGLRPHDYVVRRRVERAQQLLSGSPDPIVEIALAVGFQSQSHFTTVFKRVFGITPHLWRQLQAEDLAA